MLDLLQSYFKELKKIKPATEEEIKELWLEAKKGNQKAIRRLVELNYCLVIPIAKKFTRRGVDLMDLISDGNIGLMRAVEKFEPKKDIKFSTYATYWIEQFIRKSIEYNSKTIRLPSYIYDMINKWKKTKNILMAKINKEPTVKEIAKEVNITSEKAEEINFIMCSLEQISSLDVTVSDDSDILKKDNIKDDITKAPETIAEIIRDTQSVQKAINLLPEREAEILRMRFGIDNRPVCSLNEIGKKFNLSRERVRQIELRAVKRLKIIFLKQ